ncbi:MAG: signal peptidase I [Anaerolineales bacterium]
MDSFHAEVFPDPQPQKKATFRQNLVDLLETLLLSAVLFLGINALSARIRVDSYSMEPTLYKGDFVIVNKISYKLGSPGRGDVIVFHFPPNPEEQYIKRVIGLPGDQIHIADGRVYINGEMLAEPYLHVSTNRGGDWKVPTDSLFVMGDNRNNSSDSRSWGMVPFDNIVGKAMIIYWPPDQWGLLGFPYAAAAEP